MSETEFEQRVRRAFRAEIAALAPATLLDIGCGEGDLLREAALWGTTVRGVEPDASAAAKARAYGVEVLEGEAETLPFSDGAFDVVVFEYSAHHVRDLRGAMGEAARVAKHAVCVLDTWHDPSRPPQVLALEIDGWFKEIDRVVGKVHNACPTAQELIDHFPATCWTFEYRCHATTNAVTLAALETKMQDYSKLVSPEPRVVASYERLLSNARRIGVEEAGAILFKAQRQ
ncbi:SAM-dependent methyltransferase YafE [alpha proteobacterium U9-1i]|nr:SAM-dependent methyltransferase YafE [alpha proteobacterium U9-1i]